MQRYSTENICTNIQFSLKRFQIIKRIEACDIFAYFENRDKIEPLPGERKIKRKFSIIKKNGSNLN